MNKLTNITSKYALRSLCNYNKFSSKLFSVKGSVGDELNKNKPIGENKNRDLGKNDPANPTDLPPRNPKNNKLNPNEDIPKDKTQNQPKEGGINNSFNDNLLKKKGGYGDSTMSSNNSSSSQSSCNSSKTDDVSGRTDNFYGKTGNKKTFSSTNENYAETKPYNDYSTKNSDKDHQCLDDSEKETLKKLIKKAKNSKDDSSNVEELKGIFKKYQVKDNDKLVKDITGWRDNYV